MLPSKIVRGLYVVVLTIFTLSENSLGSPNDISPVRRNSGLDSEKKLETVLSEVKSEVNALKRKKDNKYGRKQVLQTLLGLKNDVAAQAKEIKDLQQSKNVAFMAQLSETLINPPTGTVVPFDSVITNAGDGFKPELGSFVAPVSGVYSISLVASSSPKKRSELLHLFIMKNAEQVGYVYLDHNDDRWLFRSTSIVVQLSAGDKVFVKVANAGARGYINGSHFHTIISGFLI